MRLCVCGAGLLDSGDKVIAEDSVALREFHTRLIELVVIAVHQIAILLFRQEPRRATDDPLLSWQPSEEDLEFYPEPFPPTLFLHPWYNDFDQYPDGVADGVGYWAEGRILGGVVLFDRRSSDDGGDADVSISVTYTIVLEDL